MTSTRKIISIFLSSVITLFQLFTFTISAEEFVITGNGDSSSNEVTFEASNTTSIEQTNNAVVDNNVNADANTGSNEASDNNGNVNITTGNVDSGVVVTNELNSSSIASACCPDPSDIRVQIDNNGSNSTNGIDLSLNHQINVDVNQNANIDNNVSGSANTGENRALDNNGNVAVNTGNIIVNSKIKNGPVNTYQVSAGTAGPNLFASISGSGSDSNNLISTLINDLVNINANNTANIQNRLSWDLNTGSNDANGNNGDVSVKTGDIFANLSIINDPINSGKVDVTCCDKETSPPPPGGENPPTSPPANPPGSNNPPTTISEIFGAGSSAGPAVLGLSATGGLFENPLIFWTGLLMLTFGIAILGRSLPSLQSSRNET